MPHSYLVISASLNSDSYSRIMAQAAADALRAGNATSEFIDLRDYNLPLCDGEKAYGAPDVSVLRSKIAAASGIVLATPIYNYDASAAAKNLIELTGKAWEDKVVAFLCAAGGQASYMSIMSMANSLMLDFRCLVIPRFVYSTGIAFADGKLGDEAIRARIGDLVAKLQQVASAVATKA